MLPPGVAIHTATISVRQPGGMYGDTFSTPVDVQGFAIADRKLVRGANGEETVAEVSLYLDRMPLGLDITEGSKVTVLGRESYVIGLGIHDDPFDGSLSHLEVSLR